MTKIAPKQQVLPTDDGDYVLFRSTLECRWALSFELLKIDWQYEPNRFPLPQGSYLPDFFLPDIGWLEIKPTFKELKAAETKLATFARHKSDLLDEDLPFYSINSSYPTFRLPTGGTDPMLLEWLPNKIKRRSRNYAIETFRSQETTALYEEDRDRYIDFVDRSMSRAQDAYIDDPLPIEALLVLNFKSISEAYNKMKAEKGSKQIAVEENTDQ